MRDTDQLSVSASPTCTSPVLSTFVYTLLQPGKSFCEIREKRRSVNDSRITSCTGS